MIKNWFTTAWRNLKKNKTSGLLNIAGLSIGMACFLLMALYVLDELQYDRYNTQADNIYRIDQQVKFGDFKYHGAWVPAIMGPAFTKDFPQVTQYTRLRYNPGIVIRKGAESIVEDAVHADSSLFDVFTLPMLAGDAGTALKEPHSLVLTEKAARKYFSSTDVVGKQLTINDSVNYTITGVIRDIPRLSHFNVDFFMAASELPESRSASWFNCNFQTYLVLKPGTNGLQLAQQLNAALQQYLAPQFGPTLNMSQADFSKAGNLIQCNLMQLTDIHLHSQLEHEFAINGDIRYIYLFSAIALLILLMACINFMNLATAGSANRAKEVGIRKVLGGKRFSLVGQFMAESFLACCISFVIAIGLAALLLSFFNQLAGKQMPLSLLFSAPVLAGIALLLVIVSLVAGSYPAFFLSSFQPIKVLKGRLSTGFRGSALRNTLVVLQFTISVILMIGTVVIYRQLQYISNKDLGFSKEQVLVLHNTSTLQNNIKAFTNEVMQLPGVKNITRTGFLPVTGSRTEQGFLTVPQYDGKNFTLMQHWSVDENYIPTFQMQLTAGRNFSAQYPTDSGAVIINETAARLYGNAQPLNKKLYRMADLQGKLVPLTVIGVIKDFHLNSLHDKVSPLVLHLQQDNGGMAIRVATRDMAGLLHQVKKVWGSMVPTQAFSYTFLDETFAQQYSADQRTGKIFLLFSILAICIACLGLFGLVSFAAAQRVKEIGIRKVLGAPARTIFALLSKDFLQLLFLSICIGSPVAWWAMSKWLQNFAYRINIGWWMFLAVGGICLLIALATISFQAIKSAVANPVKSLRAE